MPLIVGYVVGFASSIYPATMNRKINKNGVIFTFPTINRFLIPGFLACVVSAIVQACNVSENGDHYINRLPQRTSVQQGGWQIVGFLITLCTAIICGLIVGVLMKILNKHTTEDQFNDEYTYSNLPKSYAFSIE